MVRIPHGVIFLQTFPKALSILRPLFFLIYMNDLPEGLHSNPKFFTTDASLLAKVYNVNEARNELNDDLIRMNNWLNQWKMKFNPDIFKQTHEIVF